MNEKTPLGKIELKSISDPNEFQKVFEIKLFAAIFKDKSIKEEYYKKLEEYCNYVLNYIKTLEKNSIFINKIYFEALDIGSEVALEIVEKILKTVPPYKKILDYLLEKKATLQKTEDEVLLNESLAWLEGMTSLEGTQIDLQFYLDSLKERDEYISTWMAIDLKENENAVIFLSYERNLDLKEPLKLIKIRPPIADDLETIIKKIN
ncbi:MAG: hypothetical protein EAX96_13460 [Candidatus Lokiarchaeota archaeon]|nr:hypothetical protein [Candidatus Lokiarchaeota archaeon]